MGLFALGFILGGLFGGGIMALMNASKVNELSAEGSLGKGNSGEEMNAEYDKGYQSGYDAGYKRAMLDYGLEDDKPCEDCVSREAVLKVVNNPLNIMLDKIIEALPPVTQKPLDTVLDEIRAEIEAIIGEHNLDDYDFCSGLICARKIIDKYKEGDKE